MAAQRLVSLLPSATEMVCALGAGDRLIGRSHECDYPAAVRARPACTSSRVNSTASSAEIDRAVKSLLDRALSLYDVETDLLRALQPDLILTQAQCKVCAVSEADVERALAGWIDSKPRLLSLSPATLEDVFQDLLRVGLALEVPTAPALVSQLRARLDAVQLRVAGRPRPTVACLEWIEPLMAAGNWVPELVEVAGGINLFGTAGKHSPWLEWDAVIALDPEVIIVMPCGFGLERTRSEARMLAARPGWGQLRAVREDRVFLTDGSQYFNRPGPRLVESAEILAGILHPRAHAPKLAGLGWERWC